MSRRRMLPTVPRVIGEQSVFIDMARYNAAPRPRYFTNEHEGTYCLFCRKSVDIGSVAVRFPPKGAVRHLACKPPKPKKPRPWKYRESI